MYRTPTQIMQKTVFRVYNALLNSNTLDFLGHAFVGKML